MSRFHNDADIIDGMLRDRIEDVLDRFSPGWVAHKGKAYLTAKGPKQLGSFQVNLGPQHRGGWRRFSQGIGGGPIKLLAYLLNGQAGDPTREDWALAFREARRYLGIEGGGVDEEASRRANEKAREDAERRREQAEAARRAEAERNQDRADWIWSKGLPLDDTAAERYLNNRRIRLREHLEAWPEALRFVESIRHPSGRWSPALICRVDDPSGSFAGIWRIYITPDGQKAFGDESKLGLGPTGGGAVRLFPPINGEIAVCEGVETAFGIRFLTGMSGKPQAVWPLLSTSGMDTFMTPFEVDRVRVYEDGDLPKENIRNGQEHIVPAPGPTHARRLYKRLISEGTDAFPEPGPEDGSDYLDIWQFTEPFLQAA